MKRILVFNLNALITFGLIENTESATISIFKDLSQNHACYF